MTQEHPITPPPELVKQWAISSPIQHSDELWVYELFIARQASRWGADQELEACCEFDATVYSTDCADKLRRHRRPKPPSLKEQALEEVGVFEGMGTCNIDIIRRALESLPD
jgi:hypothetical protein